MAKGSRNASSDWIFDILKMIAGAPGSLTTMTISSSLGLPLTTAHRGVKTLQEAGYVVQVEGTNNLILAADARRLGQTLLSRFAIRRVALPYVRKLSGLSEETATLAVPLGNFSLRIAAVLGTNEIAVRASVGRSTELHRSASGVVVLSLLGDDRVAEYMTWAVKNRGVKAAALRKDLAEAQRLGYSLSSHGAGEITDIAVPIREPSGKAIAAIAVRGLSLNNRRSLKSVIAVSKETASTIETVVRENPGDFVNPYAHLPWQAVELPQLPAIR